MHRGTNLDVTPYTAQTPLGVPGYTFADLHDLARLASLDDRFNEEVQAADPALWRDLPRRFIDGASF